jgi:hypothetical protein
MVAITSQGALDTTLNFHDDNALPHQLAPSLPAHE